MCYRRKERVGVVGGVLQKEGEKLQDTTCIDHCPTKGISKTTSSNIWPVVMQHCKVMCAEPSVCEWLHCVNVCCAPHAALCGTHCPFLPKSELGTVSSVASLGVVPSTLRERELSLWAATSTEGERAVSDKDCTGCVPNTSHHTTPHHTALHHTSPHHTAPHITPHHTALHHTSPHHTTNHHTTLHNTTPHITTLHRTAPHHTTPHATTPHITTLHCTASHCTSPHCTAHHHTTRHLQYTTTPHATYSTPLHHTAPHHTTPHATTPHHTAQHHTTPHHTAHHHTTRRHTTPHHTTPHHTPPHHTAHHVLYTLTASLSLSSCLELRTTVCGDTCHRTAKERRATQSFEQLWPSVVGTYAAIVQHVRVCVCAHPTACTSAH